MWYQKQRLHTLIQQISQLHQHPLQQVLHHNFQCGAPVKSLTYGPAICAFTHASKTNISITKTNIMIILVEKSSSWGP